MADCCSCNCQSWMRINYLYHEGSWLIAKHVRPFVNAFPSSIKIRPIWESLHHFHGINGSLLRFQKHEKTAIFDQTERPPHRLCRLEYRCEFSQLLTSMNKNPVRQPGGIRNIDSQSMPWRFNEYLELLVPFPSRHFRRPVLGKFYWERPKGPFLKRRLKVKRIVAFSPAGSITAGTR